MAKSKTKTKNWQPLVYTVSLDQLSDVLLYENAVAPSELIELVDAVIQYYEAVDDLYGDTSIGLDDLIAARAAYRGPGVQS